MLIVHHLAVSQSERIHWLCEELGIPYELKIYARDPATGLAPPEYRALHPMGIAPVISDGELLLGETGAIIDYLISTYGQGRLRLEPADPDYADYLYWLHFANATLMPIAMMTARAGNGDPSGLFADRDRRAWAMMEQRLGQASYFAGSAFSAADIIMFFPLTTMRRFRPRDMTGLPNIRRYLRRVGDRPAYRRAMAKGDADLPLMLD